VTLLHNDGAGDEDHSADALRSLITAAGHQVAYQATDDPHWHQALDAPADLVAIAGGDGTVRQVLTTLIDRTPLPITVIPLGSANNVARAFGLTGRPAEELIAGWEQADRRRFRLGLLRRDAVSDVFVETVGGGLFAEAIRQAEPLDGSVDDKVTLGLRMLRRLIEELPTRPWRVMLDGVDHSGDYLAVEAMVIGETGPQVPLAPAADPEDRHLDVVLITHRDRRLLADYLDARLDDRPAPAPHLDVRRSLQAEIEPRDETPLRIDDTLLSHHEHGDAAQPTRVSVAPNTLEVLTPV
jgi:diacylglycerol kinase family enzyme